MATRSEIFNLNPNWTDYPNSPTSSYDYPYQIIITTGGKIYLLATTDNGFYSDETYIKSLYVVNVYKLVSDEWSLTNEDIDAETPLALVAEPIESNANVYTSSELTDILYEINKSSSWTTETESSNTWTKEDKVTTSWEVE